MNLLFYPRPYKARIEWDEKIVQVIVPFYMDKCGQPPAKKLPRGISSRFANLRDPESYYFAQDFDRFVAEFGFLGITDLPKEHFIIFQPPQYGEHYKENISWWVHYAQDVYILLRLYRVLKRAREHEEYDAEEAIDGLFSMWVKNGAPRMGRVLDDTPLIKVAPRIMARAIACSLTGGINISDMNVVPSKGSPIGFTITEQRYTKYLLAAIYFDLWELITNSLPVEICAYSECNKLFTPKRKTAKYCSGACRVAAYRKQKSNK